MKINVKEHREKREKTERKIEVVDSSGELHEFTGDSDLDFFAEASMCRIYIRSSKTIAAFCNYISVAIVIQ